MIKFFRKIRQNLLTKNKIGKYLLYAIGEIILVIIGILIALNLNQRSEQKKAEAKIDAIFEDVLVELENDINQSTEMISSYRITDSLSSLVLNTNLTYDDYENEGSTLLWRVATSFSNFDTSNKAYNLLMSNIDAIPDKYNKTLGVLDTLHNRLKPHIEIYNNMVWDLVKKNLDDFEQNYDWYNEPNYKISKAAIDYRLNNYKYKNKVKRFKGEAFTHQVFIGWYRFFAIKAYEEIASILHKSTDSLKFIIDYKALVEYEGDYVNDSLPDAKINISLKEEFLLLKSKGEEGNPLLGLSSKQVFFPINPKNRYYRFNKISGTGAITLTEYEGHEATTYRKED
ncbi:hypothetical protein ACFO5O_02830 [Geojedonia litorea]|uniref:Uncharacterized protein n=1 Tax=Geojedonia litorea TaxID=1268269 RepID=A0ABV9MZ58_9FLAO